MWDPIDKELKRGRCRGDKADGNLGIFCSKLIEGVFPYRSIPNVSIAVERLRSRHRDALVAAVPGQRIIIIEREMVFY